MGNSTADPLEMKGAEGPGGLCRPFGHQSRPFRRTTSTSEPFEVCTPSWHFACYINIRDKATQDENLKETDWARGAIIRGPRQTTVLCNHKRLNSNSRQRSSHFKTSQPATHLNLQLQRDQPVPVTCCRGLVPRHAHHLLSATPTGESPTTLSHPHQLAFHIV